MVPKLVLLFLYFHTHSNINAYIHTQTCTQTIKHTCNHAHTNLDHMHTSIYMEAHTKICPHLGKAPASQYDKEPEMWPCNPTWKRSWGEQIYWQIQNCFQCQHHQCQYGPWHWCVYLHKIQSHHHMTWRHLPHPTNVAKSGHCMINIFRMKQGQFHWSGINPDFWLSI